MSSTFSALKFELITTGEQSGAWGNTTNANIGTAIEQAIVGMATLTSADFSTNIATLTLTNTNAAQNARALCLVVSAASLSAAGTINVPAIQKPYLIINNDSFAVTVKVSGLTGVSVPAGKRTLVYNNGTDVANQVDYLSSLALGTALPLTSGGTGGTSASTGRTGLGATTVGSSLFTLTNPSAVTFIQINADNSVTALDAAAFRSAIGVGTGTGTVTSVATSGSVNGITLTGGPITSTGTVTLGGALANVNLATQVTGTLPIANGGTGTTSTTFVNLATNVTGNLPVANLNSGTSASSSTFWRGDGSWATPSGGGSSGVNAQVFSSNGTFTIPTGVTAVKVTVVGGGGGGAGCLNTACTVTYGGPGGGAGVAISYLTSLTPANTIAVTVGAAGTAGAINGGNGGAGGTSTIASGTQTITTVTTTGGSGGVGGVSPSAGAGGTSTNGTINFSGTSGYLAIAGASSGAGGSAVGIGIGGLGTSSGAGKVGVGYGAGGSGALGNGSTFVGGAGTQGVVIFEW